MFDDYRRNKNLSLKEKLKITYEKNKQKYEDKKKDPLSMTPNFLKKLCKYVGDRPKLLDKTGQFCYIFGLFGVASWGIMFVIPYIYSDFNASYKTSAQGFVMFCVLQIMINWLCMRMVTSAYVPVLHGAKPDDLEIGEHISKLEKQNGFDHTVTLSLEDSQSLVKRNIVYVATEMPKSNTEPPKRAAFPYWSWAPCLRCNRPRPPRCHHCSICNVCVLKRDHHCFIAGACIGYRNLRHFTVFLFWAVVGTTFGTIHLLPYLYYYLSTQPELGYIDIILPVVLIRAVLRMVGWLDALLIVLSYILICYNIWSVSFLKELTEWIREGKTSFEKTLKLKVYDTRSLRDKSRSVFGHYWIFNFIVPLHFIFEPIEDPINWPYIKA